MASSHLGFFAAPTQPFLAPAPSAIIEAKLESSVNLPDSWPAVFGAVPLIAPKPEPVAEPEPQPEVTEEPPQENTTYFLTGLVAGRGTASWAMISENDRGLVVRVGDTLIGGETVTEIDSDGVWIEYQGVRELIAVQKSDLEQLVDMGVPVDGATAIPELLAEITIPLESLDRRFIEASLTEAGSLAVSDRAENGGMDIISIRDGELFAKMGLRSGDTILSVNGKTLQSADILADISDEDVLGGLLQLEILRNGTRQMVKVTLDQG